MRFTPQFLDELRARLPVSDVVGKRVKLKKAGREWKGLSPFNQEKTPSFFVNDSKAMWFDFSSGRNGNIFDFVMATEGVSFPEAVERLANLAGLPLPIVSKAETERAEKRRTLYDVMELAARFFESTLAARTGAKARGYLADRGLDPATQLRFRLGYAPPDRFALKEALGKDGVSVEDMVEAGLLVTGDDVPVPYDRFRDRVMFPITDLRGRIIAFGGRALDPDVPAKYLNSPETPLFHKGANLYNAATARAAAHNDAPVIVVEGYVDVIALVAAGYEATVAPLGTALTEEQLALLWRLADEPVLCFDGDKAGQRAALRAVELALPFLKPGKSLRFATLPEGQDPDDLVRAGGRGAVEDVLRQARPLADLLWARETEGGRFDTPERRAALEARITEISQAIADETVRRYYRQDLTGKLKALFAPAAPAARGPWTANSGRPNSWKAQAPRGRFDRGGAPVGRSALNAGQPYVPASPQLAGSPLHSGYRTMIPRREALILLALTNHPWLLHDHMEEAAELEFRSADAQKLKAALIDVYAHGAHDRDEVARALAARGHAPLIERIGRAITTGSVFGTQPQAGPDDVTLTFHQLVALHRQWHSLIKELREAEFALGQDNSDENYAWLRDVKERLSAIDGTEAQIEGFGLASGRSVGPA